MGGRSFPQYLILESKFCKYIYMSLFGLYMLFFK
ncbi:hypothetical protein NC651_028864 [Populus alba x Populus x berolinensis]|nr:hypothetical protein NC651_028864 [Populus alba x Populus x berolinensis]